jgi:hypothetical protein
MSSYTKKIAARDLFAAGPFCTHLSVNSAQKTDDTGLGSDADDHSA